uniref:Uncharacterized protein n=1 Tax=Caenorhabditis japonica TaxID=281687 RepID=A0A8R1IY78_CAEJA
MSGLAQAYILPGTHVTSPPCLSYLSITLDHPASLWPPRTSRRRSRTSCVSLINAHVSPLVAHHLDSLALALGFKSFPPFRCARKRSRKGYKRA